MDFECFSKQKGNKNRRIPSFLQLAEFDDSRNAFSSPEGMLSVELLFLLFWSWVVISFASIIPDDPENESTGGKLDCIAATSLIQRSSACFFFHNSLKLRQASLHTLNIKTYN